MRMVVTVLLSLAISALAWADPTPKVLVVVNRADWCSVCKANGERAAKAFAQANSDGALRLIVNDLTSEETLKKSSAGLKAVGLEKTMANYTATGVLYFFDAKTRKPLRQITVANSDQEIMMVAEAAKKDASR